MSIARTRMQCEKQKIPDRDEQLGPEDSGGYSTVAEVGVREIKATLMSVDTTSCSEL